MKAMLLPFLVCAVLRAQNAGVSPEIRDRVEKAVLEVNAQMTAAGEALDIDRVFSYMLPNDRGSTIVNGVLYPTREAALASVKANVRGGATVRYLWKKLMVTVISPTSALLVAEGETVVRPDRDPEHPVITPFSQSVVFMLADGKWRVLHAHQSVQR